MALIVVFVNKSELAPVSDYNYQVLVGDGTAFNSRIVEQGRVTGHVRAEGWDKLVELMLKQRGDKDGEA